MPLEKKGNGMVIGRHTPLGNCVPPLLAANKEKGGGLRHGGFITIIKYLINN